MTDNHILALLDAWRIGPIHTIAPASSGAINQTLLVSSATGRYALRCYRQPDRDWVAREHAIIAYARSRGVPAVAPLPLADGTTVVEDAGRLYALFPFARGRQFADHELDDNVIGAMGAFLGELHRALAGYPHDRVARRPMPIDLPTTLAAIDRYIALIRSLPMRQASDEAALERLVSQRAWIVGQRTQTLDELTTLKQQAVHGDYTHTNLFFEHGQVSAVIDWDQSYLAPCAWEAIRTIDLVLRFQPERTRRFLAAYPLPLAELDIAARCYGLMRSYDTWMYAAIYDAGNDRVRAFIRPGGFVPIEAQWQAARINEIQCPV